MIEKFMQIVKRIWLELVLLSVAWLLLYFMPAETVQLAPARLFTFKAILFSASQIHATLFRKVFWKGAKAETTMDKVMAVALHVSSAYLYSQGG